MVLWEELFQQREWGQWPDSELIRFYKGQFLAVWDSVRPPEVFEIGAGVGANLWFLAREGANVSACDISVTALKRALCKLDLETPEWCGGDDPSSRLVACSATETPFPNASFDVVIDIECISMLDLQDARAAIFECYRVARPNAWIFCRMLDAENDLICEPVGVAGLVSVQSGMLNGNPPIRLLKRSDVANLLAPWELVTVDQVVRTLWNGSSRLCELIIVARKAS